MVGCADQISAIQGAGLVALVAGVINRNVNHKLMLGKVVIIFR